jgi:hypothetical protein
MLLTTIDMRLAAGFQDHRTPGVGRSRPTEGSVRRRAGSGAARNGDSGRDSLAAPLEAWYRGSEGVEALDILSWPENHLDAALSTWPVCGRTGEARRAGAGYERVWCLIDTAQGWGQRSGLAAFIGEGGCSFFEQVCCSGTWDDRGRIIESKHAPSRVHGPPALLHCCTLAACFSSMRHGVLQLSLGVN